MGGSGTQDGVLVSPVNCLILNSILKYGRFETVKVFVARNK